MKSIYNFKEKQKHYSELSARIHAFADLELLESKRPNTRMISTYKKYPMRMYQEILYALLDVATREQIVAYRRNFRSNQLKDEKDRKAAEEAARLAAEEAARLAAEEEDRKAAEEEARKTAEEASHKIAVATGTSSDEVLQKLEEIEALKEDHESLQEELDSLQEEHESLQEDHELLQEENESLQEDLAAEKKKIVRKVSQRKRNTRKSAGKN